MITYGLGHTNVSQGGLPPMVNISSNTQLEENKQYCTSSKSLLDLTIPVTATQGSWIFVTSLDNPGFRILQNAGQTITCGTKSTTTGVSGMIQTMNKGDTIMLTCISNNMWSANVLQGNLTIS